jgi:predicted PurR-regulated permease PerM
MNLENPWKTPFRYIAMVALIISLSIVAWYIRDIFKPLITAGLIAYLLSPVVNFVARRGKLKRKVAANIVFFAVLLLLVILPATVIPVLLDDVQSFISDFNKMLDQLQTLLSQPQNIGGFPIYLDSFIPTVRDAFRTTIAALPTKALSFVQSTSRGFLWFLVIVVSTYHLMTEWDKLRDWLIGLFPDPYQKDIRRLYQEVKNIWLGYLGGQIRLMFILTIIYALAWATIGVSGAIWLGILAGLLNLLPEVGPLFAAIVATLVAVLEGSSYLPISNFWFGALTLGIYLVMNNFKSIYLQPRILGKSVYLHEGVVFVAIIAALVLQGMLGVLIVVPLLASLMIIGRYIRRRLLGLPPFDDPAPETPPQSNAP